MKDGEIRPLPSNEFYQSPFDGRWVKMDEKEIGRLIDLQRKNIGTTEANGANDGNV